MSARLPHDTLREISKYWSGHRLAYTCSALYSSWNPTDHIVVTCNVGAARRMVRGQLQIRGPRSTTTSRMPNGAYHGKSIAVEHAVWNGVRITETVEHDRNQIVSSTYLIERAGRFDYYRTATIINGWVCQWNCSNPDMVSGRVVVGVAPMGRGIISSDTIPYCDFSAVARDLVAQMQGHGDCSTLEICLDWEGVDMPGTYRWG